jgi:hypothetical protein
MIKCLTVIITCGVLLLTISCKKESKNTASSNPDGGFGSVSSLSLTAYPNVTGHKWVYKTKSYLEVSYNNTTTTSTINATYTVQVIRDTLLPNNINGKIWKLNFPDSTDIEWQLAYLDSSSDLFVVYDIPSKNVTYLNYTLEYPLSSTPKWWLNNAVLSQDTSKIICQKYYNGYQVIEITRGDIFNNGLYTYRIGNKGLIYFCYELFDVINGQVSYTRIENTLQTTNF